jgi:hypothetical protein
MVLSQFVSVIMTMLHQPTPIRGVVIVMIVMMPIKGVMLKHMVAPLKVAISSYEGKLNQGHV